MILLDTCVLLWLAIHPDRLSGPARKALANSGSEAYVSSISAWEIAWKQAHGRLRLELPAAEWYPRARRAHRLRALSISPEIALRAATLPELHRDPADRFLIATAQEMNLTILTPDALIHQYPQIQTLW